MGASRGCPTASVLARARAVVGLVASKLLGTSYLSDVPPGFILVGAGVGPMCVAIPVSAMNDVPPAASGVASGIMTTGHELGAAVGVAVLTTVAGDPTTRARLVSGYGSAFFAVAVHLGALLVVMLFAVPNRLAQAGAGGHGRGRGH